MSSYTTHRDSNGLITVSPKLETNQSGLVVICHGLGDSPEGFVDVAENLAKQMPHLKIILPPAPTQPVTMNMGMPMPSWYDIVGLDERSNENCKGIEESKQTILQILQSQHEKTQLPYERMVLMGFSQGGALSLYTGMTLPSSSGSGSEEKQNKLAGIVVLSGYLPSKKTFAITPGLASTPVFHGHGKSDPMVLVQMAQKSQEVLTSTEYGVTNYDLKLYDNLPHSVNEQELRDVLVFLQTVLPQTDDPNASVKLKDPKDMSIKELKEVIQKAGLSRKTVGFYEKSEFIRLVSDYRSGKL